MYRNVNKQNQKILYTNRILNMGLFGILLNKFIEYRFLRKHRIKLQVSIGAHPRFVGNFGTREPLATATKLVAAKQTIYHDANHPSAIILPVME